MVEHREVALPQQVEMAKELLTRLGDFSAMTDEDDDVVSNIRALANLFVSIDDLTTFADDISELFVKCFTQLTVQTPILATLLSMIHKSDPTFPALVVEKLSARLLAALQHDEVQVAKLALRAVACLGSSSCLQLCGGDGGGSVSSVLEALCAVVEGSWATVDASGSASNGSSSSGSGSSSGGTDGDGAAWVLRSKGQVAAFLLATAVPWVAPALRAEGGAVLARIKGVCERVVASWRSPFGVDGQQAVFHVAIVHATDDGGVAGVSPKGPPGATCWDSLWEACKVAVDAVDAVLADTFRAPSVMSVPWEALAEELRPSSAPRVPLSLGANVAADIQALAEEGKMGARARLCAPNGVALGAASAQWLVPRFPVFDAETSPECAACATSLSELEKYTLMGYYRDIMQFFDPYLRDDGTKVGTLDLLVAHLQAVAKMLPRGVDAHLEYVLLETLFQLLARVPTGQTANACYFRVILDITKKNPGFAPAVALGTGVLYNLLPEMDMGASRELARWLSYQLVNTKLAWPYWEFWAADGQNAAAKAFCACVLDHCTRNALPDRVRFCVPDALHDLIPTISSSSTPTAAAPYCPLLEGATDSGAMVMSSEEGAAVATDDVDSGKLVSVAAKLREMVARRDAADAVEEWLESLDPTASGLAAEVAADHTLLAGAGDRSVTYTADVWRAQLLLHVIVVVGHVDVSMTTSALASLADRYAAPLRSLALGQQGTDDAAGADAVVQTLVDALGHEPGALNLALDTLLRRGIVNPAAAARWATSREGLQQLTGARDSHWWHAHVEVTVDRAIDIVRAATAHRRELGGELKIDEELLQKPRDMSGQFSMVYPSKQGAEAAADGNGEDDRRRREEEEEAAVDDEDGEPSRRRRRGGDEEEVAMDADEAEDDDDDPVTQATEAVLQALRNARAVYTTVVGRLLVGLLLREEQLLVDANGDPDEVPATDEWSVAAQSLLFRVLRSFHGAEAGYTQGPGDQQVSLGVLAPFAEVEAALAQAEREGTLQGATSRTPHAALKAWKTFTDTAAAQTVI